MQKLVGSNPNAKPMPGLFVLYIFIPFTEVTAVLGAVQRLNLLTASLALQLTAILVSEVNSLPICPLTGMLFKLRAILGMDVLIFMEGLQEANAGAAYKKVSNIIRCVE